MKIILISIGKTSFDYLKEGIALYEKRLSHYISFEHKELPYPKLGKNTSEKIIKTTEGQQILKLVDSSDYLVLFDERGKEFDSIQYSTFLQKRMNSGAKNLVFVIGGAYGFSQEVYARANQKISLSKMTFSHQMVRLFVVEQLYRAYTILKGEPYHHR